MADENFKPIRLNAKGPGGERVLIVSTTLGFHPDARAFFGSFGNNPSCLLWVLAV
jgi:hypothetical protein